MSDGFDHDDQAAMLRRLVLECDEIPAAHAPDGGGAAVAVRTPPPSRAARAPALPEAPPRLATAVAVTSGKGGVGKSNLAVSLAVALTRLGRRVCVLDADLGLANVDVLCSLTPRLTLQHVVTGRCGLAEAIVVAPGGFRLIPGASGIAGMAELGPARLRRLLAQLSALERAADVLIIDCAAGIGLNVMAFAAAAHTTLVTTTPEPPALADAYGLIKSLHRRAPRARVRLVVNMVMDEAEARGIHGRMNRVTRTFLKRDVGFAGAIPFDPAVGEAVRHRLPFALYAPAGKATKAVLELAKNVAGVDEPASESRSRRGFFSRVAAWFDK